MTNTIGQLTTFKLVNSEVVQPKKDADIIIYDPGLRHTAPFRSSISSIHGDTGRLWYRDMDIAEAYQLSPLSVLELLVGRQFEQSTVDYSFSIEEQNCLSDILKLFSGPMSMSKFSIAVQTLENLKRVNTTNTFFRAHKLLFLFLTNDSDLETSLPYNGGQYLEFMTSSRDVNFRQMITNLHAEHGISCSTNVVRCVASAGGSLLSSVLAGVEAFSGLLHGGASQEVSKLIGEVLTLNATRSYLDNMQRNGKRIPGLGHRVYKTWDPRAYIMYRHITCKSHSFSEEEQGIVLELVEYTNSEYFRERSIYPNPDLFNGLFFRRAFSSFDNNLVPLCFSRMMGWFAHYLEEISSGDPIVRPTHIQI